MTYLFIRDNCPDEEDIFMSDTEFTAWPQERDVFCVYLRMFRKPCLFLYTGNVMRLLIGKRLFIMKKAMNALLSVFLTVTLAGCGSSSESTPAPTLETTEKETAVPETPASAPAQNSSTYETYKVGETIHAYSNLTFTLSEAGISETISRDPDDTFLLPKEDGLRSGDAYRFLYYKIDFTYTGKEPVKQYGLFYIQGFSRQIQTNFEFISASVFRPVGAEEWMAGGYSSGAAQIFSSLIEMTPGETYEFTPSDRMYEARGMLLFPKEELEKGPVKINLNNYEFEIDLQN